MRYTYRDFETLKLKWTRGHFVKWTRGGIMNAWYALFARPRSVLFIPEHLLTPETRKRIPGHPKE